jgi:hypothetical protein
VVDLAPSVIPGLERRNPGASLHPLLRRSAIGTARVVCRTDSDGPDPDVLRRIVAGLRILNGKPQSARWAATE